MNTLPLYRSGDPVYKFKLMLKQHWDTGMNYLCVTTRPEWLTYTGSGKFWKRFLRKNNSEIKTTLIYTSYDKSEFDTVCLGYSTLLNVTKSKDFANLIPEEGISSVVQGRLLGKQTREKKIGIFNPEYQNKRSDWAKIGAKALAERGTRSGICSSIWRKNNKELSSELCRKGGKRGGKVTGSMLWWNNGEYNKKSFTSPGNN